MNSFVLRNTSLGLLMLGAGAMAPASAATEAASANRASSELLVIDAGVAERETLLRGLDSSVEVLLLQPGQGLAAIAEALQGRSGLDAIHLISHGDVGRLVLGGTAIGEGDLQARSDELATIGAALVDDGDILLYGCNVAADEKGADFVSRLAQVTGADVAASGDFTGALARGGDWELEYKSGAVEAELALVAAAREAYPHLLATFDFSTASGTGTVIESVSGVTVTATTDSGGLGVWNNQLFDNNNSGHYIQFSFSRAVDVSSFLVGFYANSGAVDPFTIVGTAGATTYTYTVTPSYADLYTASGVPAYSVNLSGANDWPAVDSIKVTATGGGSAAFVADTIVFTIPNAAPTAADNTVTTNEDITYTFTAADFNYSDADSDAMTKVQITTLESVGSLELNSVPVTLNQEVLAADIAAGNLKFVPAPNANGTAYDSFGFKVHDGTEYSTSAYTMTVDVTAVNDAPTLFDPGAVLTVPDTSSYVQIPDNAELRVGANQTVSMWVYINAVSADFQPLIMKSAPDGDVLTRNHSLWVEQNTTSLHHSITIDGVNSFYSSGSAVPTGQWHHLATTYDGATMRVYVDGGFVAEATVTAADPTAVYTSATDLLYIGGLPSGGVQGYGAFNGKIADVRIYNTTLSQTDIESSMRTVLTGTELGLVYNTRFALDGSGNVTDSTAIANLGTLVGNATVSSQVSIHEDNSYTFSSDDFEIGFLYQDTDSDAFAGIKVISLPTNGTLELGGVAVSVNDVISKAELATLAYAPNLNWSGEDTFNWQAWDGSDFSGTATFGITVTAVNDAPVNTTVPTISGSAVVTSTLTASTGTWSDAEGDVPTYTYQWKADGVDIAGATSSTYQLTTAEAHKTITVDVTANDLNGGITTATSAGTLVANTAPVNTGAPTISGAAVVGNTLTAGDGTWSDADGDALGYSYQWKADGVNIGGATASTYILTTAEAHKTITVDVTANDLNGGITTATSAGTLVANTAPVNTGAPTISGAAVVGNTLTAGDGTWSDADGDVLTYTYQWKADSVAISGATSSGYTLTVNEVNKTITVDVTANDLNGGITTAASAGVLVTNTAPTVDLDGDDSTASGNDYAVSWAEGDASPAVADSDSIIVDNEGDLLAVTVTLNNDQDGALEYLSATVVNANITVSNSGTEAITLQDAGAATTADFEQVLEGIQWVNTSTNPNETSRTVTVTAVDSGGWNSSAVATIAVTAVNDAPTLKHGLAFDGIDDHVVLPDNTYENLPAGTLEAWVKLDATSGQIIAAAQADQVNSTGLFGVGTAGAPDGKLAFKPSNSVSAIISNSSLTIGEWTHVAVAFDGTGASLYINGVLDKGQAGDFSMPAIRPSAFPINVRLGHWYEESNLSTHGALDGTLDSVALWSSKLADADIATHYASGIPASGANMVFSYDFANGWALDSSGNTNDGTVVQAVSVLTGPFTYQWTTTDEDTPSASVSAGVLGKFNALDPDGDTLGMAVTGMTGNGSWQYDAGAGWINLSTAGTLSDTNALLLSDSTALRYTPDAARGEVATLTFRAWDQTSGTATLTADVSVNGGASAYLAATTDASLTVTDVNDALSGNVVITGGSNPPLVGETLSADTSGITDPDGIVSGFSYQWHRAGVDISGATAIDYPLVSADIGSAISVTVSYTDGGGTLESTTSAQTAAVDGDLDGDGVGDAVDTDIDGDGIPNDWETANGLDPWDATDASGDPDGDGASNLDEFLASTDPNVDDYPPVIIPPADILVDATGLLTAVDVGVASANDVLDGAVTATSDAPSHFAPGVHTVTWSATDAAGNTGTATQTVSVNPLVSFSKDQTTSEGSTVLFSVVLNGPAATYPVSVPYTVGGTADGSDHTLVNGTAEILSGTEAVISFTTVLDGVPEVTETIVITMGTPTNAVAGVQATHTVTIDEGNVAPVVTMDAVQAGLLTRVVAKGDGDVVVQAWVNDANGDTITYDWSSSDASLPADSDPLNTDSYTFNPSGLAVGTYTLRVSVSDSGAPQAFGDASLMLEVVAAQPTLSAANDSDGDGVDDASEGAGDSDGDGIADYLDPLQVPASVLPALAGNYSVYLLESDAGTRLRLGEVAFAAGLGQALVTAADLPSDIVDSLGGLLDFEIEGFTPGSVVRIVLPQQSVIPANAVYRLLGADGQWFSFVENANNLLSSAPGEQGVCPPPGDAAWQPGLTEGHWCVQLSIKDGGPNDADGSVNGRIKDPGGVTIQPAIVVTSSGGGGAMHPLWLLLGVVGVLLMRRREREAV